MFYSYRAAGDRSPDVAREGRVGSGGRGQGGGSPVGSPRFGALALPQVRETERNMRVAPKQHPASQCERQIKTVASAQLVCFSLAPAGERASQTAETQPEIPPLARDRHFPLYLLARRPETGRQSRDTSRTLDLIRGSIQFQ